jgi:hypothetical protein
MSNGINIFLNYKVTDAVQDLTPNYSDGSNFNVAAGGTFNLTTQTGTVFEKYPLILFIDIWVDAAGADYLDVSSAVAIPVNVLPGTPALGRKVAPGETFRMDVRGMPALNFNSVGGDLTTTPNFIPNSVWPSPPMTVVQPLLGMLSNNSANSIRGQYVLWGIV